MQDNFSLQNRNFSYWESDVLARKRDFIIIGAGLVGLSAAISIRQKYPLSSILVLDRSSIPLGASTRNAGFACFGSISEIIDDLKHMSSSEVENLISKRYTGLEILRKRVGDENFAFQNLGGYEIFSDAQSEVYNECYDRLDEINKLVYNATGLSNCFALSSKSFGIRSYEKLVFNQYEGQLHPGQMMDQLLYISRQSNIEIKYGVEVDSYNTDENDLVVSTVNHKLSFTCSKLLITTNAFAKSLVDDVDVVPGRNQVMITKPIKNLSIKGTFHYDKGYVYFRNVGSRLLIGGGRNIALEEETTSDFGLTDSIKDYLRKLLNEIILPDTPYAEDSWWSGIIATGSSKKPIVKEYTKNVFVGIRLSGMGVALGSLIGQELADMV